EKPKAAAEPAAKPAAKPKEAAKPAKPAAKAKAKAKAKSGKAEAKAHVKSALTDESPEKSTGWSKLLDTFATVDKDGNGRISKDELMTAVKGHGVKESEIREAMKSIDLDDDGEINYAEFVKLLR
ncbi:unnamed protein product, partial [Effrenium voratum]